MNAYPTSLHDEAIGLYLHVPFCERKCRYCGFYSEPLAHHDPGPLVSALIAELDRYAGVGSIHTIYLGGGSPTCLPLDQLTRLTEAIVSRWSVPQEFTVECNPGQTDTHTLSMLRRYGVNRLSFGLQSFDAEELALLGRRHSVEEALRAIRQAGELGFDNIGVDLIFAIPGSTPASWEHNLQSATTLDIPHISAYSLTYEPGTALDEARRAGRLQSVDEETDRVMYEMAIDYLASAGFAQYEISNFARDGFACLHNQGYWQNRPYIGIGPSAGSYFQGRRTLNAPNIRRYIERVQAGEDAYEQYERPDHNERICETAVLNLRRREGVDLAAFQRTTGADFLKVFDGPVRRYEGQDLLERGPGSVRLARKALAMADSILCDFSAL